MTPDETPVHARKLRKVTRACDACKSKKKACTGTIPCGPCARRNLSCTYETAYHRGVAISPPPSSHRRGQGSTPDNASAIWDHPPSPLVSPPSASERINQDALANAPNGETGVAGQYWGPTSAHSFLGRVVQDLHAPSRSLSQQGDQGPQSTVSIFSFGDRVVPEVRLSDFKWPRRTTAERLVRRYFEFATPTYRVLHQPTVESLITSLYGELRDDQCSSTEVRLDVASQAIILLVFSTATMFQVDEEGNMRDAGEDGWRTSELYYSQADHLLSKETGAPRLASVQARFLMVLYMLSSSRARKSWFIFGTTVQLMMALGMHSRRPKRATDEEDLVQKECRRRVVWCSYTLDKYLSVILGRPRLWQDDDMDEELPTRINDQDLTLHERRVSKRDCLMDAPVFHAKLARILTQAAKEPYVVTGISEKEQIDTIKALSSKVEEWQTRLPPFLSGVIQPSTLVPVFRRQLTVLQLARYHALMFITRPLLLRNYAQKWPDCEATYRNHLTTCLMAARDAIELILAFVREDQFFPAFWYSQYIAFNALSIIYLYLIQVQRGHIPLATVRFFPTQEGPSELALDEPTLYRLSETAQEHLADATVRNAPSWKYSAILQGLRRELARLGTPIFDPRSEHSEAIHNLHGIHASQNPYRSTQIIQGGHHEQPGLEDVAVDVNLRGSNETEHSMSKHHRLTEPSLLDPRTESLFDNFAMDQDLILDFWPQLDSLPITYLG